MVKKKRAVNHYMDKTIFHQTIPSNISDDRMQKLLLENFIVLQKVLTDMSVRFDKLSSNIEKLLYVFEISAKTFVEKEGVVTDEDKKFLEKLDKLLDQNKTIAKGLTMMEERIREKIVSPLPQANQQPSSAQYSSPQNMQPGPKVISLPSPQEHIKQPMPQQPKTTNDQNSSQNPKLSNNPYENTVNIPSSYSPKSQEISSTSKNPDQNISTTSNNENNSSTPNQVEQKPKLLPRF